MTFYEAGSARQGLASAAPKDAAVDRYITGPLSRAFVDIDANDLIDQVDSSRDYDPSAGLKKITAPVMWVNSADDFINPPELGVAEHEERRLPHGRFVLLPISDLTHGHGTHTWAAAWESHLPELLAESGG